MKLSRILFCFLHTKEGVICKIPSTHMIDRHKKDRRERSVEARKVRLGSGARGELAKKLTGIGNVGFGGGGGLVTTQISKKYSSMC